MGNRLRVVTSIAVVGAVAGGGIALTHVPNVQQTAASAGQQADTNGETLKSLLEQSAQLHAAIDSARLGLASSSAAAPPSPSAHPSPPAHKHADRHKNDDAAPRDVSAEPRAAITASADDADGDDADGDDDDALDERPTTTSTSVPARPTPAPTVTPTHSPWRTPSPTPTQTRTPRPSPSWTPTRTRPPGGDDD